MDYSRLLAGIPNYKTFFTVDEMDQHSQELAQKYPNICQCTLEGYSRSGNPIYCLKIGNGRKKALMFGCPHPNEPMGAMMLEYFSEALCQDDKLRTELDYTWYLIKSIDVDGTKLNEKWFKGPFTLYNYARNYFRPAAEEQVEWTFPFNYKKYQFNNPMPETSVLMKLIDEQKPEFMYSLHNAGFGGTYWYITYELKEIWEKLHLASAKQQIPLSLGEPEAPYMIQFAPAIFKMTGSQDAYDYDEKYADEPAETLMVAGTSSDDYAKKYGTCCLVTELPYFYSPKIASAKRMGFARKEAMRQGAEIKLANWRKIEDLYALYKTDVSSDNPFAKMLNMMIKLRDSSYKSMLKFIESKPEFNDECKESEAFDNIEITKFYALLGWGLAVRGAEHERDKRQGSEYQRLEKIVQQIDAAMKVMADDVEASIAYSVVPIKKLVSIQLESGMIVADQLRQRRQRDV